MPAELWRPSLDLALHRNRNHPGVRLVQLATVRGDGRPSIRTVVFRGFLEDPRKLAFTTDARSAKRVEIESNPGGAVCWYFVQTREQFRITGILDLIDASTPEKALQEARADLWAELSDDVRVTFTWPPPGEPRDDRRPFPSAPPDASVPAASFCVLVLTATEVDHLELHSNPHRRWRFAAGPDGRWSGIEVNP